MKGVKTLIKLHKRNLDDLRRVMGVLEGQKMKLLQLSVRLTEDVKREIEMAGKNPEMGQYFGDYSKRVKIRQEEIKKEIVEVEKQMAAMRETIAVEFGELKKFEIALENHKKREAENERRKETIMLDELASQQFIRKKDRTDS